MKTKEIKVGNVLIGGDNPVSIQTMWDRPITVVDNKLIDKLNDIQAAGCDIIRFAVPKIEDAKIIGDIASKISMPVVADIHFDYKIALKCMDYPISKIRINPGNIGTKWKVEEVLKKAVDKNIPLRIGINGGSLPSDLRENDNLSKALITAAEREMEFLDKHNFDNFLVSLKASNIDDAYRANKAFSKKYNNPIHLGITEAGSLIPAVVKSSIYLYKLLSEGIGDTLRISISDDPLKEIYAANEILSALKLNKRERVELISCPKCGRASFDTHEFNNLIQKKLSTVNKSITVAIMGCTVNGPQEAKHADLGITGSGNSILIFKHGEIIRKVTKDEALEAFTQEIDNFEK
ncbi:flavodoxin-dependent (E)-4-hydroxy-3-methylbut-2-enyl-diphosphate synthase [Thiospirochaeta perfilievii]|uniref:4-hydroxy-3-methylbut-2-en-1-yl diphosphate synthase (flavodoxin) n=1 Tax=Thiospirochaeta perfilievii TaxID=252967 RepID=A0A5C1QEM1_9SPIO|nr:flavodoxin-dependent (E)-4-hydroxy-3-methylbut-2-enyl-diphosphate synthase [Thiospirochaeta perfilievii]QEN05847.1 flavodoxin-dependent (E)-4-hydroxy-3-methylbut-2-enyl-diphosphate synthase [Thiospirochaeta perfilievii]